MTAAYRECIEIAHSAPLPRLRDSDGTEYVARDALIAEIRTHAHRAQAQDNKALTELCAERDRLRAEVADLSARWHMARGIQA